MWTLCVICCRMMGANVVECFPGGYCSAVSVFIVLREMSPVWPNNGPGGAVWCRNIWAMDKSTSSQTYCKNNRQCWTQESYLSKSKDVMLKYYFCKSERHKYIYQYPYYGSPDWIQYSAFLWLPVFCLIVDETRLPLVRVHTSAQAQKSLLMAYL